MLIGGLLKFSLIDYPGKVAAVVFTQGCNYRCPFCHNPDLVLPELFREPLLVEDVLSFLEQRRGQLQGVVITGGEPTLHPDLIDFIRRAKAMGFLLKLDTNGSRPDALGPILAEGLVDLVAMDIKASLTGYCKATGVSADLASVERSITLIRSSGVKAIFRTTALKGLLAEKDLSDIHTLIAPAQKYVLQRGNMKGRVLDNGLLDAPVEFDDEEWHRLQQLRARLFDDAPVIDG